MFPQSSLRSSSISTRPVLVTALALAALITLHLLFTSQPPSADFESTPPEFVPSSYNWSSLPQHHPPSSIKPLPDGEPKQMPKVQAGRSSFRFDREIEKRRNAVRDEFLRSYRSYKEHAWMKDELMPLSAKWKDNFGGWAATLVDSLDTLWIMDLKEEFNEAAKAAATLNWGERHDGAVNLFETTIRHLGGLIGAYELSGEKALLKKAVELGDMLYVAFDTPNRLPGFWLNFDDATNGTQVAGVHDPSASPGSLVMEFTRLSQLTGDPKFYDATDRVTQFLIKTQNDTRLPGMWPVCLNFQNEVADDNTFSLGALADSLYEYLPKMHALLGGLDENFETMYRTAMGVVTERLLFRPRVPEQDDVLFAGEIHVNDKIDFIPETQHLTCFVGGMFALGGKLLSIDEHVNIGERLARGCGWAYKSFATGLMPEIFKLDPCPSLEPCDYDEERWEPEQEPIPPGFKHARDPRYLLRPEAIESIFILYRVTGDPKWQDMAWDMFQSIIRFTTTEHGNAAVEDVISVETAQIDSMESFWLSETLKYFYLIFSPPDLVSLDEFVLNTEAHPFRRPT
ncbi:transcription factor [Fusarium albosuccineum]|uniref:alpha-1,2-Mannosidase n=1 Tax=Fusarium albosuccineum TaxID=1237068 RepID=A0A8H4LB70_9HYPO|nr:transcription factor [Fusarium albosuccineum]